MANSHADDFPYIGSILALSNSASRSFDVSSFAGTQLFAEFDVAAADDHAAENLCNSGFLVLSSVLRHVCSHASCMQVRSSRLELMAPW